MGLIFVDGFDHYTTFPNKGWTAYGTVISVGQGRFGTNAFGIADDEWYLWRSLGANRTTLYIGGAIKVTTNTSPLGIGLFSLWDGATPQCGLIVTSAGIVHAIRGYGYVGYYEILGSSSGIVLPQNEYHYVEAKFVIDNSAGEITVRVDGVQVINATSKDTQVSANAYVNVFYSNWYGGHAYAYFMDDFYIADDAFKGDCRVETLMPESEGAYEQFLNPDSTPNYSVVDEVTPNTADYVYANLAGSTDSYGFPALDEIAGNIKGVAVNTYVQKDSSGTKTIGGFARVGGDEEVSAGQTVPSSWGFVQQFIDNPADSDGNWNVVDVNAAEFGQQVIS